MNYKHRHFYYLSIIIMLLPSCTLRTKIMNYDTSEFLRSDNVYEKNYSIGKKNEAYVGESIIKVKGYKVDIYVTEYMQASNNFELLGTVPCNSFGAPYDPECRQKAPYFPSVSMKLNGLRGIYYEIIGKTSINKINYVIISLPLDSSDSTVYYGLLIKEDGRLYNKVVDMWDRIYGDFEITPKDVIFTSVKKEKETSRVTAASNKNYELIYGGTDGKSFTLTYREYTSDDFARPAFYQTLTYEATAKQIRFREIVIKLYEISNEKIVYSIVSDGLTP